MEEPKNFNDLPTEIIIKILNYCALSNLEVAPLYMPPLNTEYECHYKVLYRMILPSVCKRWNEILKYNKSDQMPLVSVIYLRFVQGRFMFNGSIKCVAHECTIWARLNAYFEKYYYNIIPHRFHVFHEIRWPLDE